MPERFWMNDPNGPAFFNGIYHLFYQHNPDSIAWTNMHWGHSVSKDLVFWKHLPAALSPGPEPYDAGGIWSGSISIDPITRLPVILYTGVSPQVQCVAYPANISDVLLTNWTKSPANPLVPAPPPAYPQGNFRDPTTSWRSADGSTYILVGSGNDKGGAALLYRATAGDVSRGLQYVGHPLAEARDTAVDGAMWECPDFYPLQRSSSSGAETSWVLKASSQALGHGDHYYTGVYDQAGSVQAFRPAVHGVYDYGSKFYASKSFLDDNPLRHAPPRQVLWAWINEADDRFAQRGWAGVQSLPRVISLDPAGNGTLLLAPLPELTALRLPAHWRLTNLTIPAGRALSLGVDTVQTEILIKYSFVNARTPYPAGSTFGLNVLQSRDKREQTGIVLQGPVAATDGLDLPGGDFRSVQVAINDVPACESACLADPLCHAWTLIKGSPGRDNCWLKASVPAGHANSMTVSGVRALLRSNRTKSSLYPKADSFDELGPVLTATGATTVTTGTLHVFVDHSIVEAFVDGGRTRLTTRVYPTLSDSRFAELFVAGPYDLRVESLDVWQLRSIWAA